MPRYEARYQKDSHHDAESGSEGGSTQDPYLSEYVSQKAPFSGISSAWLMSVSGGYPGRKRESKQQKYWYGERHGGFLVTNLARYVD